MNDAHETADVVSEPVPRYVTEQMQSVLDHLSVHREADEDALMELLTVKRTRTYLITRQMVDMGLLTIIGRGKHKKYVRSKE